MRSALGRYELYLVLAGALWGTSFVAVKIGVEGIDPFLYALLRFALASAILLTAVLLLKKFNVDVLKDRVVIAIGFLNALAFSIQNVGIGMTTATNAVLLVNINVGFMAILAALLLGELLTRRIIIGMFIGLVGVVTISTNGDLSSIYSGSLTGNVLVFASGVLWAFCIVFQKKVVMRYSDVLMVTVGIIALTALFLVPLTLIFTRDYTVGTLAWESTIYVGVMCTALAYLLYTAGLQGVKASVSSIILLLEIVFAMIFAVLLLSELPTVITAMGGALIVVSIVIISFSNAHANGTASK